MTTKRFTKQQLNDFRVYEDVRRGARFNMFDPNARALTGLDRAEYIFVMENYEALRAAVAEEELT